MKKLVTIAGMALVAASAYTQGTVSASSGGNLLLNGLTGAPLVVGSTFKVGLYYLPDTGGNPPTSEQFINSGILLGPSVNISPVAGRYATGTRSTPSTTLGGGQAYFQVRAWESAFGATYNEVLNNATPQGGRLGLAGVSDIVKVTTGDPGATPAGTATAIGVPGFVLNPVPEPSVIGLGLLGVGALLLLRRRK